MLEKKNSPLFIALAVPVLMIILVAAFIYLPGIGKKPSTNFLYITGSNVYDASYNSGYQVSGNRLVYNPVLVNNNFPTPPQAGEAHFYVYDVTNNQAKEVNLAEAQAFKLDSTNISPDGYSVQQGNSGGDFLFGGGGGDYNSWFIKGHNRATKLNLKLSGPAYSNFRFLGWLE